MFIDKLSSKQLNIIGITSASIALLMLILTIVLPNLIKTKKNNDYVNKSIPKTDNTDIWASFPGEINTTLKHNYEVFGYTQKDSSKAYSFKPITNFSILEEVKYQNFTEDKENNTIFFNANRTYAYIEDKKDYSEKNVEVNSINMGLFEALETLTYPPLYKMGINSLRYLFSIGPEIFIRELFAYKLSYQLNDTIIKDQILKDLPDEKVEKILNAEDQYSLNTTSGLYQWIKILGLEDEIDKAAWLPKLFNLTREEIDDILYNKDNYLMTEFENYFAELNETFPCYKDEFSCKVDLSLIQLLNKSVIATLGVQDYLTLHNILLNNTNNTYPFEKTIEMNYYFENDYKKKNGLSDKELYSSYGPTLEQVESLLLKEYCLLSPNNSIYLLHLNKTDDVQKQKEYFLNLTQKQLHFVSDYFFDYLPGLFLYPTIETKEEPLKIEPLSKTVSSVIQGIADKTYKLMSKLNIYGYLLSFFMAEQFKVILHTDKIDEICGLFMQQILDDGKKVLKICSDDTIGLNKLETFYRWAEPYYCRKEQNSTKCNMFLVYYLQDLVYLTDDELDRILTELDEPISYGIDTIKENYECGDQCDEKDYFNKMQFLNGTITLNAPEPLIKTNTIRDWVPDDIPYPIEISYYKEKYKITDNYTDEDIEYIINLVIEDGEIYDIDNYYALNTKLKLEKEYSLYMKNKGEKSSLISLVDFLINVYIFNDEFNNNKDKQSLFINYSSLKNLLQGNDEEDKFWINFLSSGNYFDNYKIDYSYTTGLDLGLNLDTKEQDKYDFDYLGINTKIGDYGLRMIKKMNDLLTLNVKKKEYDLTQKKSFDVFSPLFNYEKLYDLRKYSDGFQYDPDLNIIYYYDTISSRPLRFNRTDNNMKYKDKITCLKYILDVDNITAGINENYDLQKNYAMITQKTNKPYMISVNSEFLKTSENQNVFKEELKDNFICVDPISDMVVQSKINVFYGIYTRNYGFMNEIIESDKFYPIFTYQRTFEVDVDSYERVFPGISEYYTNMAIFIFIGIFVTVLATACAVIAFYFLKKREKNKDLSKSEHMINPNSELKTLQNSEKAD